MVKMPQQPYGKLKELKAAQKELQELHEIVDTGMVAARLGWKDREVEQLLDSEPKVFSGDTCKNDDDGAGSFFETLYGSKSAAPQLDDILKKEIAALVAHCLGQLKTARQRLILTARYLEEMRLKDLAVRFNCTEQAVHYQEGIALKQMRSCLENNDWQWDGEDSTH
jgi:RNA polymerase sigma factor (sigma-70 family)